MKHIISKKEIECKWNGWCRKDCMNRKILEITYIVDGKIYKDITPINSYCVRIELNCN